MSLRRLALQTELSVLFRLQVLLQAELTSVKRVCVETERCRGVGEAETEQEGAAEGKEAAVPRRSVEDGTRTGA